MVHHVVSALTMKKNIYMKKENDALLLGMYIKHNIENKILKRIFENH